MEWRENHVISSLTERLEECDIVRVKKYSDVNIGYCKGLWNGEVKAISVIVIVCGVERNANVICSSTERHQKQNEVGVKE